MVDRVKEERAVDCTDDIVVHDEDSCLSRMVTTIRRLPGRQQAVLIAVMDKTPSDSTFDGCEGVRCRESVTEWRFRKTLPPQKFLNCFRQDIAVC